MSLTEAIRRTDEREFRRRLRARQFGEALAVAECSGIEDAAIDGLLDDLQGTAANVELARISEARDRDDFASLDDARDEEDGDRWDGQS